MSAIHRSSRWLKFTAKVRPIITKQLPLPCVDCGQPVFKEQKWDVGHRRAHALDPFQVLTISAVGPSHRSCNRSAGAKLGRSLQLDKKKQDKKLPTADSEWMRGKTND